MLQRIIILSVLLLSTSCHSFSSEYKPRGIDLSPITQLKIHEPFAKISSLKMSYGKFFKSIDSTSLSFRSMRKDPSFMEITQFDAEKLALSNYISQRKELRKESHTRLYDESNSGSDRYFIVYKTAQWDTNHGIPIGIYSQPEITIGILKQNLLIMITYVGHENDFDYIKKINEDIQFVGNLLNDN